MSRALLLLLVGGLLTTGCSHSAKPSADASSTTTSSPASKASVVALDRRLCAAYEAFWDTAYSSGEPSSTMLARERALIAAAEATPDASLHDHVRAVIDAELGLPRFDLRETESYYRQRLASLDPDTRRALEGVEQNNRLIVTRCDALGHSVAG